jgi:hypothetical protein
MKKPVEIAGTALLAILLLVLADRWLQPVPIPAATAVAGGLVALWLGRRVELVGASVGGGALLGVAVHVYAHRTGNSTFPPEGLPVHAVIDGVRGLAVAVVVILDACVDARPFCVCLYLFWPAGLLRIPNHRVTRPSRQERPPRRSHRSSSRRSRGRPTVRGSRSLAST